jgi:glutamate-1-semialdehyde 2,1-aminomutase
MRARLARNLTVTIRMPSINLYQILSLALLVYLLPKVIARIRLSRAKHRSLAGHSKISKWLAKKIPYFSYSEDEFFAADSAPDDIVSKRRLSFMRLKDEFVERSPRSIEFSRSIEDSIPDVDFTRHYRVPFPFREYLIDQLPQTNGVVESRGVSVQDLDGNWRYDVSGSYGVNVLGYDFYKECLEQGWQAVKDLGPVLGAYHPLIKDNVERLKSISGLDSVSFHMSGTEAVMQAVRLARYHTGRKYAVRFCGAYHGWWDGVQPGIGNPRNTPDALTLSDMSEKTLKVLRTRKDIACVLVNPLQALHPNSNAPGDGGLINSGRSAHVDKGAYSQWLKRLQEVCSANEIVLIMDEVFSGFRLAYRGAQEFFSVQADMVTYGKSLGGGLPVGVLCGRSALMKRYRDDRPMDFSFARGTFNSHPQVMASMNCFLKHIDSEKVQDDYRALEPLWSRRVRMLNERLQQEQIPIRVVNLVSIWTVIYLEPCRYNWMFQFYLQAEGLHLGWTGTGRLIFSHNYNETDFTRVADIFVEAAKKMRDDGWMWHAPTMDNGQISRQFLREIIRAKLAPVSSRWSQGASDSQAQLINKVKHQS